MLHDIEVIKSMAPFVLHERRKSSFRVNVSIELVRKFEIENLLYDVTESSGRKRRGESGEM
jgi:hypothetical protein